MVSAHLEDTIAHHQSLINFAVGRFRWAIGQHGISRDDLESEATIGIIKASKRFDPKRLSRSGQPARFSSFAKPYVLGEIRRFLQKFQPVKVSQGLYGLAGKILNLGLTECKASEIAMQLSCNEVQAQRALNYLTDSKTASLEAPLGEDSGTLADVLAAPEDQTAADVTIFVNQLEGVERKLLSFLMKGVSPESAAPMSGISTTRMMCAAAELKRKARQYFDFMEGDSPMKKLTRSEYVACKEKGMSDETIAEKYEVSTSRVYVLKKKWNLVGMSIKKADDEAEVDDACPLSVQPDRLVFDDLTLKYNAVLEQLSAVEKENALLKALLKNYL